MSDLAAALAEKWGGPYDEYMSVGKDQFFIIEAAARERLRLSKVLCEICGGTGKVSRDIPSYPEYEFSSPDVVPCPACNGSGEVWPAELVEVVAKATHDSWYVGSLHPEPWEAVHSLQKDTERDRARFVLDAVEAWMEAGE